MVSAEDVKNAIIVMSGDFNLLITAKIEAGLLILREEDPTATDYCKIKGFETNYIYKKTDKCNQCQKLILSTDKVAYVDLRISPMYSWSSPNARLKFCCIKCLKDYILTNLEFKEL